MKTIKKHQKQRKKEKRTKKNQRLNKMKQSEKKTGDNLNDERMEKTKDLSYG